MANLALKERPISTFTEAIGLGEVDILFTKTAVVIGLVYAYLPFDSSALRIDRPP